METHISVVVAMSAVMQQATNLPVIQAAIIPDKTAPRMTTHHPLSVHQAAAIAAHPMEDSVCISQIQEAPHVLKFMDQHGI